MKLVIGDKLNSSWSMRPWVLLTHFGIPFEETPIRLNQPDTKAQILALSPNGQVPCLITDTGVAVCESLAIAETIAELHPKHAMWPRDADARARARSISAEMHAGFTDLRQNMPMDLSLHAPVTGATPGALANIARIEAIWAECLAASGGPFLFGEFGIADAMYAPVVMRFNSYAPTLSQTSLDYARRVTALPAVAAWIGGAREAAR
ncbi:glutathione S-transferase family protein [Caballeronia sp. LZ035]|uniref:glutathione S-transferase family protein n=1 Tax=Caballeronia sp. LZ035 TaxID=3038568 RepID=UPI002862EA3F|nr:glutathione S-transferase family protein [Caballeronia sp. LZ035]MDR5755400.1 glutathione S-transferase family protein [Caballeronia sp. LZ035]